VLRQVQAAIQSGVRTVFGETVHDWSSFFAALDRDVDERVDVSEIASGFAFRCPHYAVLPLVSTVGAVIMPHNIYLHSGLVRSRVVDRSDEGHVQQSNKYMAVDSSVALLVSFFINAMLVATFAKGFFTLGCAEPSRRAAGRLAWSRRVMRFTRSLGTGRARQAGCSSR